MKVLKVVAHTRLKFESFRYENGIEAPKYRNKRQEVHSIIIVCSILTMAFIFCSLLYVFIDTRTTYPGKAVQVHNSKPKEVEKKAKEGIEVIEISGKNKSDIPRRIKRLDSDESERSPDSQKLVFYPGRKGKPPKTNERPRVINFSQFPSNHRISSRMVEPRPFNHHMHGAMVRPNGFQMPMSTSRTFHTQMNNIQDVIRHNHPLQNQMSNINYNAVESSTRPVQLSGKYRHPRKNGEIMQIFSQHLQNQLDMVPDPFHNFKPNSPLDVNQMAMNGGHQQQSMALDPTHNQHFRRKFRQKVASIPNYQLQSKDVANIYQNVLHTGKGLPIDRNEDNQNKQLSMLLDIFPMPDYENNMQQAHINQMQQQQQQQQQPMPHHRPHRNKLPRLKPFQGYYQDPNVFNSMQYPQLMPRYPAYFRYPQNNQAAGSATNTRFTSAHSLPAVAGMKPSQLVVHLNLFPKNKPSNKRTSLEDEVDARNVINRHHQPEAAPKNKTLETSAAPVNINFNVNTNGHPENLHHQANLPHDYNSFNTSTEPGYYYDESDEDQGLAMSPSLAYSNIHRDRPLQMMLKSTSTTPKPSKKQKNQKFHYETIERPKKKRIRNEPRNYNAYPYQ